MLMGGVGIAISYFKAFGKQPQGFERILPVNVIIGRNNSGKSTLLDVVEVCTRIERLDSKLQWEGATRAGHSPEVWLTQSVGSLLGDNVPGEEVPSQLKDAWRKRYTQQSWFKFKDFWRSIRIRWRFGDPSSIEILDKIPSIIQDRTDVRRAIVSAIERNRGNNTIGSSLQIAGRKFHRIAAERRIGPEELNTAALTFEPGGFGVTNLLTRFIIDRPLPRQAVEERLLDDLNAVFEPEASFTRIELQRMNGNHYEIFLTEKEKGSIALSASGSGLQTTIMTLTALDVLPLVPGQVPISDWVFAFEELENNLHPALQRRLFWLIYDRAVKDGFIVFLTTHSPVVVDLFADAEKAQLLHVSHDGASAIVTPVLSHLGRRGVLDDLDVRASDLLQSNAIVWVEGPTDRMYFNRWVQLWACGELREGKDYQCVFYGGALLAHLTAGEPEGRADAVEILRVNPNAVMLIDSDRRSASGPLKKRVERLKEEMESVGGVTWVTKGKEVEHYIPQETFKLWTRKEVPKLEQYADVLDYLNGIEGKPNRKAYDKVQLAHEIVPLLTREALAGHLDLAEKLDEVCASIRAWNKKRTPPPLPVP